MTMHVHILTGCSPVPLANYLKALGILRLIGEQVDAHARGWWEGERFCLLSKLSKEELEEFFLNDYEPTPLVSPWNKGCGFFKPNDPGLSPLENSTATRFKKFRQGVVAARQLLDEIKHADGIIRAIKARTKTTAKGFQTDEQRQLLATDTLYLNLRRSLQQQIENPTGQNADPATSIRDLETIEFLTRKVSKPSTKKEAEDLKSSSTYKRLLALGDRRFKTLKATLIPDCKRSWRGPHSQWLAAAVVLDEASNPEWPSLLGTGGNDGNLDFTNNFMQQLNVIFDVESETGKKRDGASALLGHALWSEPSNHLTDAAIGQYQPGSAGGVNSSTGFVGGSHINSWDFILMMEGSVLFTSRATKRLDPNAFSRASAPFAVKSHAIGFVTPGNEKAQRGEQWMPLWCQPATLQDLTTLLGEARVQLNRQPANRPVDMARAISRLGVARGIESFARYGYLERNGQSTLAVPLGRVQVRHHPRAYLIDDQFAGWMDRLQRRSRDKNAPARLVHAERRLADAVFSALTHDPTPDRWQAILLAAAEIESLQASGTAIEAGPIPGLRPDWIAAVAEDTAEFRLALALGSAAAGYDHQGRAIDPVRHHVLPLKPGAKQFQTSEKRLSKDTRVVMFGREPLRDLVALVERRLIEAAQKGQRRSRLVSAAGCGARLDDLDRFLTGALDVDRILHLSRAFMAIRWEKWSRQLLPKLAEERRNPDECWLTIRLCFLPWPLAGDRDIPADQQLLRLLSTGDVTRSLEIARQRLRSCGIRPPIYTAAADTASTHLSAAALAFPIQYRTANRIINLLDPSTKGTVHA